MRMSYATDQLKYVSLFLIVFAPVLMALDFQQSHWEHTLLLSIGAFLQPPAKDLNVNDNGCAMVVDDASLLEAIARANDSGLKCTFFLRGDIHLKRPLNLGHHHLIGLHGDNERVDPELPLVAQSYSIDLKNDSGILLQPYEEGARELDFSGGSLWPPVIGASADFQGQALVVIGSSGRVTNLVLDVGETRGVQGTWVDGFSEPQDKLIWIRGHSKGVEGRQQARGNGTTQKEGAAVKSSIHRSEEKGINPLSIELTHLHKGGGGGGDGNEPPKRPNSKKLPKDYMGASLTPKKKKKCFLNVLLCCAVLGPDEDSQDSDQALTDTFSRYRSRMRGSVNGGTPAIRVFDVKDEVIDRHSGLISLEEAQRRGLGRPRSSRQSEDLEAWFANHGVKGRKFEPEEAECQGTSSQSLPGASGEQARSFNAISSNDVASPSSSNPDDEESLSVDLLKETTEKSDPDGASAVPYDQQEAQQSSHSFEKAE